MIKLLGLRLETIAVILLLIPPFFSTVIPYANRVIFGLILCELLLVFASLAHEWHLKNKNMHYILILLIILYAYIVINRGSAFTTSNGILWLVQFGSALLTLFLLSDISGKRWIAIAFRTIAIFGLFYALATIVFWLFPNLYDSVYPFLQSKSDSIIEGRGYRAGLTTHYSTNGMYIVFGFLASSCMAFGEKRGRGWAVAAALCLFALVLTTKRAHLAFGAASFSLSYFALNTKRKISTLVKFVGCASLVLLVLYAASFFNEDVLSVLERFQSMEDDDSFGGRSGFYRLCLSMWNQSPIVGHGWGSYTHNFNQSIEGFAYLGNGYSGMNAHNVYLQMLAEEGIIGFLLFISIIVIGFASTFKTLLDLNSIFNRIVDDKTRSLVLHRRAMLAGSLSFQTFFALYCMTGNPLYDSQVFVPWIFALGIAAVLSADTKGLHGHVDARIQMEMGKTQSIQKFSHTRSTQAAFQN